MKLLATESNIAFKAVINNKLTLRCSSIDLCVDYNNRYLEITYIVTKDCDYNYEDVQGNLCFLKNIKVFITLKELKVLDVDLNNELITFNALINTIKDIDVYKLRLDLNSKEIAFV